MSFRAIWIGKSSQKRGQVLLSRKYPTVERRYNLIHKKTPDHILPDDDHIIRCVLEKLQVGHKSDEFMEEFDSCQTAKREVVLELKVKEEIIWPIIAVQKFNFVFICLCLVEKIEFGSNTPLVEIPSVAVGYALLHNMIDFLELVSTDNSSQVPSNVEELGVLLKIIMPFGTPSDTNFSTMKSFLSGKNIGWLPKYRMSEWRPLPGSAKAKNQLHLSIKEHVNAAVYSDVENAVFKDMCHVYGTVSCNADIAGVPEVSLNLVLQPNIHIAFHPCLQYVDIIASGRPGSGSAPHFFNQDQVPVSRHVCFTPPHGMFPLCHINGDPQFPLKGVYKMKIEQNIRHVNIKLQLSDGMKNLFEYFEVHIPFFYSKPIAKWDYSNTCGTLLVSPDKRKLVWSVGQKFPKNFEIRLNAIVVLAESASCERSTFKEDPFCHGNNSYVQIYFKSTSSSLTGVTIDPKSIKLNPSSTPKVNIVREMVSSDFKIWNIYGDALVAFPPTL